MELINNHLWLLPPLVILFRIIGIVIPPVYGGIFTYLAIPFIGWFYAFLLDMAGGIIGSSLAFYIARKFKEPLVARFLPLKKLSVWEKDINESTKLWSFLMIRIITGPVSDIICYLSGLSSLSFKTYIIATTISLSINQFMLIYFAHLGFTSHPYYFVLLLLPLGVSLFLYNKYWKHDHKNTLTR